MKPLVAILMVTLAACTQVPELNERVAPDLRDAPYPPLIPLEAALAWPVAPAGTAEQLEQSLAGRRDGLKARARALQVPVVDPEARARMDGGVAH